MSPFAKVLRTILLSAWAAGAGGFAGTLGMMLSEGTRIGWADHLQNAPLALAFLLVVSIGLTPLGIVFGILLGSIPTVLIGAFLSALERWRSLPWSVWPLVGSGAGLAVTLAWPMGNSPGQAAGSGAGWAAAWTIGGAVSMTIYWFLTHAMFEHGSRARA